MNHIFKIFFISGIIAALAGCGGMNTQQTTAPTTPTTNAHTASAVINISDAPSDRLIKFELSIDSITLTKTDGTTVNVLSDPRRVELTHLAGTTEALVLSALPQGNYMNAVVAVSDAEVTFINDSGQPVSKELHDFSANVTVPISPALAVDSAPLAVTLDLNAQNSVTIDLASGNITINPAFTFSSVLLPASGHEADEDADNGAFEHVVGQVTAVTANNFTVRVGQSGLPLTFNVNSLTRFEEGTSLANILVNSLVRVEGVTQAGGSPLATEVEILGGNEQGENEQGELEGVITATSGNPVSSFSLQSQDGSGSMAAGLAGSSVSVQLTPSTKFELDGGQLQLSGLNLPQFSAASLTKAQRVEVDGSQTNGIVQASRVRLEQQALTGTVSALSNSQFTLTLANDSASALLSGLTNVTVFTGNSTKVQGVSLANGSAVKVRGLLMLRPTQGSYVLVASGVTNP